MSKHTDRRRGHVKGEPIRFVSGHNGRGKPSPYAGHKRSIEARAKTSAALRRHGHASGGGGSRTYTSWLGMIQRTTNPHKDNWKNYGGRGVTMCDRWRDSFEVFLADMGERPEGMTLDRIDNDGNYEPGNCRWATQSEQLRNRRPREVAA